MNLRSFPEALVSSPSLLVILTGFGLGEVEHDGKVALLILTQAVLGPYFFGTHVRILLPFLRVGIHVVDGVRDRIGVIRPGEPRHRVVKKLLDKRRLRGDRGDTL